MSMLSIATPQPMSTINGQPITNASISAAPFMSANSAIGGTSGPPGSSSGEGANVLSMNLGGVNVNYDMGPSTGEATNDAYNFLGNSFAADSALLGNTIVGSQNFLSGFAAPVLNMAQTQENFNTQVLPSMFGTLSAQNYSLGSQAVQAESSVAQSSVAASSASASEAQSGGGAFCFITTAVCEARHEPDNGPTLTKLRAFRDSYMQENKYRQGLVWLYYRTAPALVQRIKERADADAYLQTLFDRFIAPACDAIDQGLMIDAFTLYTQMLFTVQEECSHGTP